MDPDGNLVPIDGPEARAQELGFRFEGWFTEHEPRFSPVQERFLKQVGEQIRVNGGAISRFGKERFVQPPFSLRGGLPAAVEAFGGEDQLDATLEELNANVFGGPSSSH